MFENLLTYAYGIYIASAIVVFVFAVLFTVDETKETRYLSLFDLLMVVLVTVVPVLNTLIMLAPVLLWLGERLEGPLDRLLQRLEDTHVLHLSRYVEHRQGKLVLKQGGPMPWPKVATPSAPQAEPRT